MIELKIRKHAHKECLAPALKTSKTADLKIDFRKADSNQNFKIILNTLMF